jgi:hypothetical protein
VVLSAFLLLPVGLAMMLHMAASNTLIQAMAPDVLRGRVIAVYSMILMGMTPFGALMAGWLADRISAPAVVGAGGLIIVVAGAIFAWQVPALRAEARQQILAQQAPGEAI